MSRERNRNRQPLTLPESNNDAGSLLGDRAMLIRVVAHSWGTKRRVPQLAEEAAATHDADADMIVGSKDLVVKGTLTDIKRITREMGLAVTGKTLPWGVEGDRILPAVHYDEVRRNLDKKIHEREDKVNELIARMPEVKATARAKLGKLYDEADYPDDDALRHAYRVDVNIREIPSGADFRVKLISDAERERVARDLDRHVNEMVEAGMHAVWEDLHAVVTRMVERLPLYKVTEDGTEHPFRDSLVENIRAQVDVMDGLNITNSNAMTSVCADIRARLLPYTPEALRADPALRQQVANDAAEILKTVSDFIG